MNISYAHENVFANEVTQIKKIRYQKKDGFDVELGICAAIHVGGRNSIINDNDNDLRLILIYLCIKGTNAMIRK